MAKKQTFESKLSKGGAENQINVKVIQGYRSEKGSTKYMERFVRIGDLSELDKIDLLKTKGAK